MALAVLGLCTGLQAADLAWIGPDGLSSDGSWTGSPAYWNGGALPTTGDSVIIGWGSTIYPNPGTVHIDAAAAGFYDSLSVGKLAAGVGRLTVNGELSSTDIFGSLYVAESGAGTLIVNAGGAVNAGGNFLVGQDSGSLGHVYQYGGTVALSSPAATFSIAQLPGSRGYYLLQGGSLGISQTMFVANGGTYGEYTQTGGTLTVGTGVYVGYYGGEGVFNLTGGFLNAPRGKTSQIVVGGYLNSGTFNFGDANGTATLTETGAGAGVQLTVRDQPSARGAFQGWGDVGLTGALLNNGRIIADGYGTDRELNLSHFAAVQNTVANAAANGSTNNGWFARNHGKLTLPAIAIGGTGVYYWGDADNNDLVSSVRIDAATVSQGGRLSVALLSPDRADVPAGLVNPVGVWDFSLLDGLAMVSAALAFRYDDALAAGLGINEADLKLYRFGGGTWQELAAAHDTANHWLTASGLTSFSEFAIASGATPEPATLTLLALGATALVARRRRR